MQSFANFGEAAAAYRIAIEQLAAHNNCSTRRSPDQTTHNILVKVIVYMLLLMLMLIYYAKVTRDS